MPFSPPPPPPVPGPPPPCKTGDGTCCCPPQYSASPIQYANGTAPVTADEVLPPRKNRSFGHQRRYSNQRSGSYSGIHGYNWWATQLPYAASPGTNIVAITFNSDLTYWFDKVGTSYIPRYAFLNVSLVEDTIAQTFTFADASDGQTETTVFNSLAAGTNPGAYLWNIDAGGVQTTTTITAGQITETQRSYTIGGIATIESILYAYHTSGSAAGYLETVTYRTQVAGGSWTPVEQGSYTYCGASDPNGSLNDLQSASQQLPDGMGGWNTVGVEYYRYWLSGSTTGYIHAMKMHFGQEAYRLMFNAGINLSTASDATVLPYADHYFEFDPTTQAVTKEISAVCASCPGGGTTADLFSYSSNGHYPGDGFGIWKTKTVQTLPDGSQIVVYSSYASIPILRVQIDPTGLNMWGTFYRYDSNGQVIWVAQPSAVALPPSLATLEAYDDLLNYSGSSYAYLNNSTGLINVTGYDANLNLTSQAVRNGQTGSDVLVAGFSYTSNTDANGITIYLPATSVAYPDATNPSITITTGFTYTFYSGTNQISQRTTTLPLISAAQNGSNASDTIVEEYDTYGNRTQRTDERGIVDVFTFDVVRSRVTQQILNYQSGVTAPGVNLTTNFTYDDLGRLTQTIGPSHTVVLSGTATAVQPVTWGVYNQSALPGSAPWPVDSTWMGNGYFDGTNYTLVDPVALSNMDKDGRSTDTITSVRSTGSGALSASDTFAQTDWQNWNNTQYDEQHRTVSSRVYHNIPTSGLGTVITNYGETDFGYDALERQNRLVAPGGTITRTVWTCPQWVLSTWVGTNDTGATDAYPDGSNSIQFVQAASGAGSGTSFGVTPTANVTAGNTLIAYSSVFPVPSTTAISDSQGNTWTQVVARNGAAADVALWIASGVAGGSTTVTFTITGSSVDITLAVAEYSGILSASPVDVTANATGSSTTPAAGSMTTANASDLLIGAASEVESSVSWSAGSGYILRAAQSAGLCAALEDQLVTATGSYNPSFTTAASAVWTAVAAAFKSAAATGNNMVLVTENQWDGGSAGGDGNLTQQTQYVSATSGDTRVTAFGYDFRDRRISVTDATNRYALTTIDNLGRPTMRQRYATLGGNLISQTAANWDDRSRIFQSIVYAVDPSTGTVGNALTGNMWYDPSGNVLQQIPPGAGQVFTKSEYNGVNWVTASYIGYNTSGYSYSQAGTVTGDIIVEQKQNTFDEVGNVISVAGFQRLNDTSPTATGALGYTSAAYPSAVAAFPTGSGSSAPDASGNGNNATLSATGVSWASGGPTGTYLSFDSSQTGQVQAPDAASLRLTGDLTLAAWINPTDFSAYRALFSKVATTIPYPNPYDSYLGTPTGVPSLSLGNGLPYPGSEGLGATAAPPTGTWSHFAVTVTGTAGTFYQNAVPNGTFGVGVTPADGGQPLNIGLRNGGGVAWYGGLADLRLYNRGLTQAEILGLYNLSPAARVSYSARWFDGIDRTIASANYGAISSFTRPTTPPSSSATLLVSSISYDNASRVYQTTDPKGIVAQNGYDNANRKTQTIEDVGGIARTTNFTFTLDNLIASMTAVNSTTGDQTTTYLYGTTLAESSVARNDLLRYTIYPDTPLGWSTLSVDQWANLSVDDWANLEVDPADSTQSTYNRLGEQQTFHDQRGTLHTYVRDKLGRQTDDCVTTVGVGTDSTILRISTAYEVRGMVQSVTSYDNATPGSGTAQNQCYLTYNTFSQLIEEQQDHAGTVSGSSPKVQYGYDTGASNSNEIRFTTLTYPNGEVITSSYGTSGGINDYLNRIETIQDTTTSTELATYTYLGLGTVVRIAYPQPAVWLDLWGGTSGTFNGLDLFNRIIDQRWQNNTGGTPADIDRYQYGYDQNSNRLWKANIVGTANVAAGLDELYDYDNINRLATMQRGVLNGSRNGFTGTIAREMDYTLDPTGNWSTFLTKTSATTDLDQTRTSNTVNELTAFSTSIGTAWATPAYDPAGNITTMPQPASLGSSYTAVYDAWNRMVKISAGATIIATYAYDGRNRRIVKVTISPSETRHFYYTDNWRDIEERVGASTSMDKQYVFGVRYIDELVCRYDATPETLYALQDATFNVTSILDVTGAVVERLVYDPYGGITILDSSWATTTDSYGWTCRYMGELFDVDTELPVFRERFLHSQLAVFTARNSLGYVDGSSLYQALAGSPISTVDPMGLPNIKIGGASTYHPPKRPTHGSGNLPLQVTTTENVLIGIDEEFTPLFFDEPSTASSMCPVAGPFRNAMYDFHTGQWVYGSGSVVLTAFDVVSLGEASGLRASGSSTDVVVKLTTASRGGSGYFHVFLEFAGKAASGEGTPFKKIIWTVEDAADYERAWTSTEGSVKLFTVQVSNIEPLLEKGAQYNTCYTAAASKLYQAQATAWFLRLRYAISVAIAGRAASIAISAPTKSSPPQKKPTGPYFYGK